MKLSKYMKYFFEKKDHKEDLRYYTPEEYATLVEKVGPTFLKVLDGKAGGTATPRDERYLGFMIKISIHCRELYEREEAWRREVSRLKRKKHRRRIIKRGSVIFGTLLLAGTIYGVLHRPTDLPVPKDSYRKPGMRLDSLVDIARIVYKREIVLDQVEIGSTICSGSIDPAMPAEKCIRNFVELRGIEVYTDPANVIHVRKIQNKDSIGN